MNKITAKMVFRTIGLVALGLLLSSLTPIAYGPLAVIAAPWRLGVMIWAAIELNREDTYKIGDLKEKAKRDEIERLRSLGVDLVEPDYVEG